MQQIIKYTSWDVLVYTSSFLRVLRVPESVQTIKSFKITQKPTSIICPATWSLFPGGLKVGSEPPEPRLKYLENVLPPKPPVLLQVGI